MEMSILNNIVLYILMDFSESVWSFRFIELFEWKKRRTNIYSL